MTMKRRLSSKIEALRNAAEKAEHRVSRARGSYGAASDVRRIDPETGKVIEVIARRTPDKAERMSLWRRKTAKR